MRRDVRLAALAVTALAILGGGLLFAWPRAPQPGSAEFDARFQQAVIMLHAGEYEYAAVALHRLLEIAPEVPEVHANMGYALLGLHRPQAARDFFEGALALRPRQANAYYGLAMSLEALGDTGGALGAMRTYVHLSPPEDEHVRKALAAIRQWEAAARLTQIKNAAPKKAKVSK